MWKCKRCEKENPDSAEVCIYCEHARTMDYTGHRTLCKIRPEITDKWKQEQNDPENLKKQAIEYLRKAEELLRKSGLDRAVDKTREVITEVNQSSGQNKKPNIRIIENHHLTEQNAKQNASAFRYGGENVLGGNESPNIRIVENHHLTEQNTSAFRYGGENVLGGDTTL